MDKQKNNNGIITLLIIIIVALFILITLMATGIVNFNSNIMTNDTEVSENNSQTDDNSSTSNNVTINNSKLLDLSKLEKYKNFDGSYGTKEIFAPSNDGSDEFYNFKLSLDGKVSVCNKNGCNNISNTSDVVDIAQMVIAGQVETWKYYILQDNGDVYFYELGNVNKGIYTATKVTSVSNVVELVNISYNDQKNAGGLWVILAVTQDNEYIQIDAEGV